MSLTNRVSLFFLIALGLVLVGFSTALYFLADHHLRYQADHRLETALQTLAAAIEVHPADVEWEPLERHITMGDDPAPDQLRWSVHALNGKLLDCSPNLEKPTEEAEPTTSSGWRVLTRSIRAGNFRAEPLGSGTTTNPGLFLRDFPPGEMPGDVPLPHDRTYHGDGVVLTVAMADSPIAAELRHLMLSMVGVSTVIWLTAAFWGRLLCRRALAPITKMAASARSVRHSPTDCSLLDVAPSRDELEDLGKAFNDILTDLRHSLERQHRFTGDASHQLRTPLTAMLASVEVALRQDRPPAEYQRVLGVVRRRGVQLRQIIESLLFLARAESDCHLPDAESIDLAAWCRSWLDSWADHPRVADLSIAVEPGIVPVRVNPALLGQVLDNLLDNACKYSQAGSPVVVSVTRQGSQAVLAVSDQGCGIAAEELPLVCEPFYRSAQVRWTGAQGVGLGLTVARRLITLLGGQLNVESQPGQGCRFRVIVPIDAGQDGDDRQSVEGGSLILGRESVIDPKIKAGIYNPTFKFADKSQHTGRPSIPGKEVEEMT